jgi:hypothetical protein
VTGDGFTPITYHLSPVTCFPLSLPKAYLMRSQIYTVSLTAWHVLEPVIHGNPAFLGDFHVVVGTLRGTLEPQYRVAMLQKSSGGGVQDFIEEVITNLLSACGVPNGEGDPLANHRDVTGFEEGIGDLLEPFQILRHKLGVIVCTRAVGAGNQNHQWFGHEIPFYLASWLAILEFTCSSVQCQALS